MIGYVVGLLLIGLGFSHPARSQNVLGVTDGARYATSAASDAAGIAGKRSTLRVLRPVLTKEQEDEFQKERKVREAKITSVSEKRTQELRKAFQGTLQKRIEQGEASRSAVRNRIQAFDDNTKKQNVLAIADAYESMGQSAVSSMQDKLTAMLTLLDKISVSAAALHVQGKDVSHIDSDITAAQARITSALTIASNLADTIPTALTVSSEESAKTDIRTSVQEMRAKLSPLHTAFLEAREAVRVALAHLKLLIQPVDAAAQ